MASSFHLTSNEHHSKKIKRILNSDNNIFNIGSLSLLNLKNICIPNWNKICDKLKLKKQPFILVTFHPETINPKNNFRYLEILKSVFENISSEVNLLITSSNADTYGDLYNNLFYNLSQKHPKRIFFVKTLGKLNYFSAIKNCEFVLGNSSSGIIEAASFKKYALNVGDRQLGRVRNDNVIDVEYDKDKIINMCKNYYQIIFMKEIIYIIMDQVLIK